MEGHKVDTIRSLKFDGKNFLAYKEGLKAALRARKCWKILTGEETKPEKDGTPATKKKRKEWREKVLLLNDILTNTLDDVTRVRLAHLNKPQAKWAALVDDFEKKSFAVALFKRRELLNVEFDPDNESIRDYIHRVEAIRQELTLMQEEVSDKEMITALLTGLGEKYENMVETFDNLDDYSLQQVKIKLTSREERLNQAKAVTEAKARKQGNGQSGVGGSQFGSTQSDEKEISFVKKKRGRGGGGRGQAKRRRAEIDCHNCGKFGHYAYECRAPKKDQQQQGGKQSQGNSQGKRKRQQNDNSTCEDLPGYYNPSKTGGKKGKPVNMIEVVEEKPTPCLTSTKVENASGNSFFIPFVLDNASGVNICGCKEAFVSLTSECDTVMKWFDNSRKKAQMKGLIKFAIVDAQTKARVWITVEALYVEGATNLLSQRKLYKEYGFFAQTSKDQEVTTLTNRVKHIAWQFEMVGDLYQTMVEVPRSQPTLAVLQTSAQPTRKLRMWHYRLAHANWQVIKDMSSKEMVKGLELTKEDRCGKANCLDCDMAKMKRMSFKKATPERATVPFVKVLMDLGFLGVPTLEGNNVYLHLIDEGSRYQWLYGQKTKEETVEKLKCFRDQVSAKHHKIVNTFHSDQGTEFLNQDMSAMCAGESVQIFAHPHTPEEICLIEKAHDVLMNKVRSVLYSCGLPGMLWGEAASYVIETANRTSTKGNVDQVTPHEKMFGSKPSVRHLRPFGCLAIKFVDKVYRKNKLSVKGAPTLMVGYATKTKGYRLLDLETGVITEHRHENVKFYEETTVDRAYVENLLNEAYRLRRRPNVDSSKLPLVRFPVVDVNELDRSDRDSELRRELGMEVSPTTASSDDQSQREKEPAGTSESEESLEEKPPPRRKRYLPVEVKNPRRSARARKKPTRLEDFVSTVFSSSASATATMKIEVPESWKEMMASSRKKEWLEATKEEFLAQLENGTWELVPRPKNAHILKNKWVWTLKENELRVLRFKARLVVLGCYQIWGIDFDETFAPVVRFETLRLVFLWAGLTKAVVKQFDFVTAFLNAPTERIIYMEQPEGFVKRGYEDFVCLLKKSIYGLRQSPRNWNNTLHLVLIEFGFNQSYKDEGLYWIRIEGRLVLLPIYVDDILLVGKEEDVDFVDNALTERFKMKILGDVNYLIGLQIKYEPETHVSFKQTKYIQDIMTKFNMESAYPVRIPMTVDGVKLQDASPEEHEKCKNLPYRSLVGCLQYLVSGSRPELATAVRILSKFLNTYGVAHWRAAKRVLRYIIGSQDMGLQFDFVMARQFDKLRIEVYTDANFASEGGDMKSVSGFVVFCNEQLISARCWKQDNLAESTCEAELIAANTGLHDAVWLEQLVDELDLERESTTLYCDSSSARELMKHAGKHRRTKQINISDLKIREYVKKREVKIEPVSSKANVADLMTKPLPQDAFQRHREKIGVHPAKREADESHAQSAPSQESGVQSVREENIPESGESDKETAGQQSQGRRGILVRFKKRARAKWKKKKE